MMSPVGLYVTSNTDVIAILMDYTNYPNAASPGTLIPTVNTNYQKNPLQHTFLSAKTSGDTNSPGVGNDLQYRDPWGNPYIITMDLNEDNKCEDPFYASPYVSSSSGAAGGPGVTGLNYQTDGSYAFHGNVMVWSMGPNGPFNHSPSSFYYPGAADPAGGSWALDAQNKNHVLSWTHE